jgi:hypothetical protein
MRMCTTGFAFVVAAALVGPRESAAADTYGAGVSLGETTPTARVLAGPEEFEGRTVRVEGVVTAVCTHMGCWMALAPAGDTDPARTLMIKVDDGVIVFPVTAKGRRAAAQGVVQRVGAGTESAEAASEHAKQTGGGRSAEKGVPVSWQIKATGAVVY